MVDVDVVIRDAMVAGVNADPGFAGAPLVVGTSAICGPMLPPSDGIAHRCISVLARGGPQQSDYRVGDVRDGSLPLGERRVQVQVIVRASRGAGFFSEGQELALLVRGVLHATPPVGLIDLVCLNGHPLFMDMDEDQHYWWTLNFLATLDA